MSKEAISTKGLTKKFGEVSAVNNISLTIKKGELFGLLGLNGAGKSTFMKLLTGQMTPTSGSSKVLGVDPSKEPVRVKERIGIVPEIESPPSFLTPTEYLNYVGLVRGLDSKEEKTEKWLKKMDLLEYRDVMGKNLSKGTKQRTVLAAAFIHEPEMIFMDEPFIGLDPYHQKITTEFMESYLEKGGTIFLCTHILEIAEKLCHRLAIVHKGRILVKGTVKDIEAEGESLSKAFLRITERNE